MSGGYCSVACQAVTTPASTETKLGNDDAPVLPLELAEPALPVPVLPFDDGPDEPVPVPLLPAIPPVPLPVLLAEEPAPLPLEQPSRRAPPLRASAARRPTASKSILTRASG